MKTPPPIRGIASAKGHSVYRVHPDGQYTFYESITAAAKATRIGRTNISFAVRNGTACPRHSGSHWCYSFEGVPRFARPQCVPVIYEGQRYESIADAARKLKKHWNTIDKAITRGTLEGLRIEVAA